MIEIDRIRMTLPAGYQHRSTSIALLVGDLLAKKAMSQTGDYEQIRLNVRPINIHTPDIEIAKMIVAQISEQLGGGQS